MITRRPGHRLFLRKLISTPDSALDNRRYRDSNLDKARIRPVADELTTGCDRRPTRYDLRFRASARVLEG